MISLFEQQLFYDAFELDIQRDVTDKELLRAHAQQEPKGINDVLLGSKGFLI